MQEFVTDSESFKVFTGTARLSQAVQPVSHPSKGYFFIQLVFNMSNGITDTLEFISRLIYLAHMKGIYTQ
jgi:hypothetical protein